LYEATIFTRNWRSGVLVVLTCRPASAFSPCPGRRLLLVVGGGEGFGAAATTRADSAGIDEKEQASARDLGRRVAEIAAVVKRGTSP
jgi:hypothetical protein